MKNSIRVFFFGNPSIAVPTLKSLFQDNAFEVVAVGVSPDKPVGRKKVMTSTPVKKYALENKLPVCEITKKVDIEEALLKYECDVAVVVAFGHIISEKALEIPKYGMINVHFSLLPKYRGASPVQSALLSGDTVSGITWQKIAAGLDTGAIYLQKEYDIKNKKCSELFEAFAGETGRYTPDFLKAYVQDDIASFIQDESLSTKCSKFEKKDGKVDPRIQSADDIWKKYLAFDIWPQIFIETKKGNVKLLNISKIETETSFPLSCAGNSVLYLEMIQIPGKKPQSSSEISLVLQNLFS